jgi:hypothetical protein
MSVAQIQAGRGRLKDKAGFVHSLYVSCLLLSPHVTWPGTRSVIGDLLRCIIRGLSDIKAAELDNRLPPIPYGVIDQ